MLRSKEIEEVTEMMIHIHSWKREEDVMKTLHGEREIEPAQGA